MNSCLPKVGDIILLSGVNRMSMRKLDCDLNWTGDFPEEDVSASALVLGIKSINETDVGYVLLIDETLYFSYLDKDGIYYER